MSKSTIPGKRDLRTIIASTSRINWVQVISSKLPEHCRISACWCFLEVTKGRAAPIGLFVLSWGFFATKSPHCICLEPRDFFSKSRFQTIVVIQISIVTGYRIGSSGFSAVPTCSNQGKTIVIAPGTGWRSKSRVSKENCGLDTLCTSWITGVRKLEAGQRQCMKIVMHKKLSYQRPAPLRNVKPALAPSTITWWSFNCLTLLSSALWSFGN